MILITKNNVSEELLTKIIMGASRRTHVAEKFLLQTREGVHTVELRNKVYSITRFFLKHTPNSPYTTILKNTHSSYITGSVEELVDFIKNEDYGFYMRGR